MGIRDFFQKEKFIEVNGERISLKGKSASEVKKLQTEAALKASNYHDDEHLITEEELQGRMAKELEDLGIPGYTFKNGITFSMREQMNGGHPRNKLTPKKQKPEWLKFLEQLSGFFALLLWFGSILCFIGFGLRGDLDNLYLGIVLAAVVLITGCFSYFQEAKSAALMAQFSKLMAQHIYCQTDKAFDQKTGQWHDDVDKFDPIFLERGDIVVLQGGDQVPADCRILEGKDFKVDNSPLTGEPDALERTHEPCKIEDPKEATNLIFFGTAAKQGTCKAVVLKIGDNTFIGRIATLTESTDTEQTPINKEIHHFIGIVSAVAITLGVTFFLVGVGLGTDMITNLVFMIGIIVANVPEGLLATVTVALTLTSRSMASKQVLVKNMEGVETLGSTTCICSDKTGTLTQNKMTVAELLYDQDIRRSVFVEADPNAKYSPVDASDATFKEFLEALFLNTTATFRRTHVEGTKESGGADRLPFYTRGDASDAVPIVQWETVGDASESSMIKFAQFMHRIPEDGNVPSDPAHILQVHDRDFVQDFRKQNDPRGVGEPEATIPFNSANKYHVVITRNKGDAEYPFTVWIKGAPERILNRCDKVMHVGREMALTDTRLDQIQKKQDELMSKGRRVLAFARRHIHRDEVPPKKTREEVREIDGKSVTVPIEYYFETSPEKLNFPMGEQAREVHGEVVEPPTPMSAQKLCLVGMIALIDPPRPSVPDAVLSCQMAGVRVVMVTGDHPKTAAAIAGMVNIITSDYKVMGPTQVREEFDLATGEVKQTLQDPLTEKRSAKAIVVPGWEFSAETCDEKWKFIFSHDEIVFARTSPQQKLQIVQRFQQMDQEIVAVTGDGVNDAPALKKADIGVAMGIAGTEVSKSAADMILMDDNFASIVNGVEEGRLIFDNLKKSIAYTLSSNIPEIAPFLVFITVRTPLPLSTVLILCIDLGTDMVPAISMAWENAESDIMRRPPRDAAVDRLVTKKLVSFAYLQIGMIQALAGFFTWFVVMNDYGYPPHILPGLGANDNWGKQILYCQLEGGVFKNLNGDVFDMTGRTFRDAINNGFFFWDDSDDGVIQQCTFAAKNMEISGGDDITIDDPSTYTGTEGEKVVSRTAIEALHQANFVEYIPWKAFESPFWENQWLAWDLTDDGAPGMGDDVSEKLLFTYQPTGLWEPTAVPVVDDGDDAMGSSVAKDALRAYDTVAQDHVYTDGSFLHPSQSGNTPLDDEIANLVGVSRVNGIVVQNIASRMAQKETLHHAQCAYFVSIVVVQWADLLVCKTRWLSIYHQGMRNSAMNFGLMFETILAAILCYVPVLNIPLGTRNLRALHWVPAVPFSIVIFLYDESRKAIMRATSPETVQNKQIVRNYGWLARHTYY